MLTIKIIWQGIYMVSSALLKHFQICHLTESFLLLLFIYLFFIIIFKFLATLCGKWELSSLTRD